MKQDSGVLEKLAAEVAKTAVVGEFEKTVKPKLDEIIKAADTEGQAYHNAYPELRKEWQKQDVDIDKLKAHLESCYPDWRTDLQQVVCKEIVCELWALRYRYQEQLGGPERALQQATEKLNEATTQLDAWKTISKSMDARLKKNKALYQEICTLDRCEDHRFALYIFWFELLPQHQQLGQAPEDRSGPPEKVFCKSVCEQHFPPETKPELVGLPWLVNPETDPHWYAEQLKRVFTAWRDAGKRMAEAQADFDHIKTLRDRYLAEGTAEAKRNAAREALRRYNPRPPCKPCTDPQAQGV